MEQTPEVYKIIEEPAGNNTGKKSRVRREAFTGSSFSFRLLGVWVMISSVIAVLPIRRGVQRFRNFFLI